MRRSRGRRRRRRRDYISPRRVVRRRLIRAIPAVIVVVQVRGRHIWMLREALRVRRVAELRVDILWMRGVVGAA